MNRKKFNGVKGLKRFLNNFSDSHPVASTALTFGSIGAGGAALAGLIRDLNTAIEDKKKKDALETDNIGPDTIVLRIPKKNAKTAEDRSSCADPEICRVQEATHDKATKKEALVQHEMPAGSYATAGFQRDLHGQFTDAGEKTAGDDGVLTRTGKILGGGVGLAAGFMLVKKLHERLEQNRLKKQITAAQQEYLDLISGNSKQAAVGSVFLCNDPLYGSSPSEKQAGVIKDILNIPDGVKNISATALASYIAMALGTGYVTKKVLQSKFDEEGEDEEPPKINRILFKSSSDRTFEIDHGSALATIGVMMDCIRDSHDPMSKSATDYAFIDKITKTPEGKQWLLDVYAQNQEGLNRNVNTRELPGLSAMDKLKYSKTLLGLKRHPGRHMAGVRGRVMKLIKEDPEAWYRLLGQKQNRDLVGSVANRALTQALSNGELGQFAQIPLIKGFLTRADLLYRRTGMGQRGAVDRMMSGLYAPRTAVKAAQSLEGIQAWMARSKTLSDKTNRDLAKKLDTILERLPTTKKKKKKKPASETNVVATDPEAREFVLNNGEQIAGILNSLKEQGLVS